MLISLLILYLTAFGMFLSLAFCVYNLSLSQHRSESIDHASSKTGLDMWIATLLDRDFEPATVRFKLAKLIPAAHILDHSDHKENFSRHMQGK